MKLYKRIISESQNKNFNDAVDNIKSVDPDYFKSTLEGRLQKTRSGSYFHGFDNTDDLEKHLRGLDWEQVQHPDVIKGSIALRAISPSMGTIGVARIDSLPHDTPIKLIDRKKTGFLQPEVESYRVPEKSKYTNEMWAILGGEPRELWTVHPGEPVMPSRIEDKSLENKYISAKEALSRGLTHVKLVD